MDEKITDKMRLNFRLSMYTRFEKFIDLLVADEKINYIENLLARNILFESTENNHILTESCNIAQEFMDNEQGFVESLQVIYNDMRKEYPNLETMNITEIESIATSYADNLL